MTSSKNTTTITDVLKTIADDKSLVLFNTIALSNGDTDICISALELTRKQYYSRLFALLKAGLMKRAYHIWYNSLPHSGNNWKGCRSILEA